jgi:hypothetical protein
MSELHVQQIKGFLKTQFSDKINLVDCAAAQEAQKESTLLTRSMAALAIMNMADTGAEIAASAVTDGTDDNGIDAIYYDNNEKILFIVQSKWHSDGRGSIERGDIQKFLTGFRDLVNMRFDRFNDKVKAKQHEVEAAVYDAQTRVMLIVIYSGQDPLSPDVKRDLDDFLEEMNDPTDTVILKIMDQAIVHGIIATGVRGAPINFEIALSEWGQIREPYKAVYGYIQAMDIAAWWDSHYPAIFAPNLRMFLGQTDVNSGIMETLKNAPDNFWYFNNGITVLCSSILKKPIGGSSRDTGVFECKGASIVNGAQTVGAIAAVAATQPDLVSRAKVLIRFISLEDAPEDLGARITQYTNTQNRIERRDFVTLDPEQSRLRTELQIDGVEYVFKSGETVLPDHIGFDLTEASVALACSQTEVSLAVQAKREIGKLWEDISKAPYKALFNPSLNGRKLWDLVKILRIIDTTLNGEQKKRSGRDRLFAIHGNRFIAWLVLRVCAGVKEPTVEGIKSEAIKQLNILTSTANALYPDTYLSHLFKNLTKCKEIAKRIS